MRSQMSSWPAVVCLLALATCLPAARAGSAGGGHVITLTIQGEDDDVAATWTWDVTAGQGSGPSGNVYLSRTNVYNVTVSCSCGHDIVASGWDREDMESRNVQAGQASYRVGFITTRERTLTASCPTLPPATRTAIVHVLGVDILQVPEYVYAEGKGAVPVEFQVIGYPDSKAKLSTQTGDGVIEFYYKDGEGSGWTIGCSSNIGARFAALDKGFGDSGNGGYDTYWAWMLNDSSTFQSIDVEDDTTEDAKFRLRVKVVHEATEGGIPIPAELELESIHPGLVEPPWFEYGYEDAEGRVDKVFGDPDVEVVDLDTGGGWQHIPLFKESTKQTEVDKEAEAKVRHTGSGCFSIIPPPSNAYCWSINPNRHDVSTCKDAQGGALWPSYVRHDCAHGPTEVGQDRLPGPRKRKVNAHLGWGPPHGCGGERLHLGNYRETVGVYFGFSYGTREAQCLGEGAGRDLEQDTRSLRVHIFKDATRKWSIYDVGDNGTNFGPAAVGAFTLAGALSEGSWSALFWMTAWAFNTYVATENDAEDQAQVSWFPVRNVKDEAGEEKGPYYIKETGPITECLCTAQDPQEENNCPSRNLNLADDGYYAKVGYTHTYYLGVGAGCTFRTDGDGVFHLPDKAGAWGLFEWPASDDDVDVEPYGGGE